MSSSTVSRYIESNVITSPTKIYDSHENSFAEEHVLDAIAKETELRLKYQREHNREAHQIRYKDLEKRVRNDENDEEDSPIIKSGMINGTSPNSLLLQKFLNSDIDIRSIEPHDLKRLLSELELKYKSLMITNASMYNDKQALQYQVDACKDMFDEFAESLKQTKRQLKDKSRDFDFQNRTFIELRQKADQLETILMKFQELLETHDEPSCPTDVSVDEKLQRILNEKVEQCEQMNKLKLELEEEKYRSRILREQKPNSEPLYDQNINELYDSEQQRQLIKETVDLKNRLQRVETDNGSLQQENKRYEAQLARYKQELVDKESAENSLQQERRRLQRELRTAHDQLESERMRSGVFQRENERLRELRKKTLYSNTDDNAALSNSPTDDLT